MYLLAAIFIVKLFVILFFLDIKAVADFRRINYISTNLLILDGLKFTSQDIKDDKR